MKKILLAMSVIAAFCRVYAQPCPPPNIDVSMLTNHAALVGDCFNRVAGVTVQLQSQSQVYSTSPQLYAYTNQIKNLDTIAALISNSWSFIQVTAPTDQVNIAINFLDSSSPALQYDWQHQLFNGWNGAVPVPDLCCNNWKLPDWAENISMSLNGYVKIKVSGLYLGNVRIIGRDAYGNAIPTDCPITDDGFMFPSSFAADGIASEGIIVFNGSYQCGTNANIWYGYQNAFSLVDAKPRPLAWVEVQAFIHGSPDFVQQSNTNDLTLGVSSYTDYNGKEYGVVPLQIVTLASAKTNMTFHTFTYSGQYATSYQVTHKESGQQYLFKVPAGSTTYSTGTTALPAGTYNVIPLGIQLNNSIGYIYGGKG